MKARTFLVVVAILSAFAAVWGCKSTYQPVQRLSSEEVRSTRTFPFDTYDGILHRYVDTNGRVDYDGLRQHRADLDRFLAYVADAGPTTRPDLFPTNNHKLAFAIAAYNATVMRNVIDRPPYHDLGSLSAQGSFFRFRRFVIDGHEVNLEDYETQIREAFHEPRVHFALNCASGGCPRLPNEAFVPERVDEQLDREAHRFCNEDRNVHVEPTQHKVVLSKIFDWYAADFQAYERAHGNPSGNQITFINRYRAADAQLATDLTIEFRDYDWTINAQRVPEG